MRPLVATLILVALLMAPVALAAPNAKSARGQANGAEHRDAHDDEANDNQNRTARAAWRERIAALVTAWHENASAIRERCHAAEKPGENATEEARTSWAHCIRDGYKAYFEILRAERKEARMARHA